MNAKSDKKKALKEAKRLQKLKAEAEAQKQLKLEELQRQIYFQNLKKDELSRSWLAMMLKINTPKMLTDVEVMRKIFHRNCDRKDHFISHLLDLVRVAEHQYSRCLTNFCESVDSMIKKFLEQIENSEKQNKADVAALLQRNAKEDTTIKSNHDTAETHLRIILYHKDILHDNETWAARGKYIVKEDDVRADYFDIRQELISFLENHYSVIWDSYKAVIRSYIANTCENQKLGRNLRKRENVMADIIDQQGKKIGNSDNILRKLRNELQSYETGSKQIMFRNRYARFRAASNKMKEDLAKSCELDSEKLDILVNESNAAKDWLEKACTKVEKILRLAALCRKHETLREKVMPLSTTNTNDKSDKTLRLRSTTSLSTLAQCAVTTPGQLNLWNKVSKAELMKRALLREKALLEKENEILIQNYNETPFK